MRGDKAFQISITERDYRMLQFIWRWKLVSTASLYRALFSNLVDVKRTHRRLQYLKKSGLVTTVCIRENKFAWRLTQLGLVRVKESLGPDSDDGFLSETIDHDILVTAVHLGPLTINDRKLDRFSEQELRCLPMESFPEWVPQTTLHRSDGYWQVPIKDTMRTIALEVERNQKKATEYECVSRFYSENLKVFRVVWVVGRLGMAESLDQIFKRTAPKRHVIHTFVSEKDIREKGWQAPIISGLEAGKPLSILLQNGVAESARYTATLPNLDLRRFPYDLTTYDSDRTAEFFNRPIIQIDPHTSSSSHHAPCKNPEISLTKIHDSINSSTNEG